VAGGSLGLKFFIPPIHSIGRGELALEASSEAPTTRIYTEKFKISIYLWMLARHIQLNRPMGLSRSAILEIVRLEGGGLTELRLFHEAIRYGMLRREEKGFYLTDYEVADTLVHRIPIGIVEGQYIDHSAESKLWREALRLRHAWADFVKWVRAGMSPTEIPLESIAIVESYGIKPFVEVKAPNGQMVYTTQLKDIYLITRRLSNGPFVYCIDFPEQGQGAKLCAVKKKVLRLYLVPQP